ncbi:MAG: hypothetical protein GXX92_01840 [Clostridiales bacterium]|nr:hypothetical protein [Clostridiales bacterium]
MATNPNFVRIYNPKTGQSKEVHVNAANGQYKLDGWTTTPPANAQPVQSNLLPYGTPESVQKTVNFMNNVPKAVDRNARYDGDQLHQQLRDSYTSGAISEKEFDGLYKALIAEGFNPIGQTKPTDVAPLVQPQEVSFRPGYTPLPVTAGQVPAGTTPIGAPVSAGTSTIGLPALKSAEELAKMYGNITYDEDAILSKFNKATEKEYAAKRKEYEQTEDEFYNRLFGTQSTALDTIRRANSSAITTGASRGFQAASEIAAMLGLQQESVDDSTKLAQARTNLVDKEAEAYTKNVVDALTTANTLKQALATIGADLYAADTQLSVGQLQYLAQLDAAARQLEASIYGSNTQKDVADINVAGQLGVADKNLLGVLGTASATKDYNMYAADQNYAGNYINALANLLGVQTNAASNLEGTKYAADQSKEGYIEAAKESNAAQKAYYDYMKSNGGSGGSGSSGSNQDWAAQVTNLLNSGNEQDRGLAILMLMASTGAEAKEIEKLLGLTQESQPIIPDILGISTPLPPKEGEAPGEVSKATLAWYSLMYKLQNPGMSLTDAAKKIAEDFLAKGYTLPKP